MVPTVTTERLILRGFRIDDFDARARMWADPRVTQHIGGKPRAASQVWTGMLAYAGHWAYFDYGYWAVEERASGTFVGEVGFADFRRDIAASMRGVPEMGWVFAPAVHGRGYARESIRAALAWADERLAPPRIVALIDTANTASLRVADVCGFRIFATVEHDGSPAHYLERIRA